MLSRLRRSAPALLALLLALVAVQRLDMLPCADEVGIVGAFMERLPAEAHHESDADHDGGSGPCADCLCHVLFVCTDVRPSVTAPPVPGAMRGENAPAAPPTRGDAPPSPVPLTA